MIINLMTPSQNGRFVITITKSVMTRIAHVNQSRTISNNMYLMYLKPFFSMVNPLIVMNEYLLSFSMVACHFIFVKRA